MNKHLIILLVAFVAVNAFVKRDTATPATTENYLKDVQEKLLEFTNKLNTQLKDTFDAEKMKTEFNKLVDTVNNAVNTQKDKA